MSKSEQKPPPVQVLLSKNENILKSQDEKSRVATGSSYRPGMRGQVSQASLPDMVFLNMDYRKNDAGGSSDIDEIESELFDGSKLRRKGADTTLTGIYEEEEAEQQEAIRKAKEKEKEKEKEKGLKGFTRKLFKKEKGKTKQKVKIYETDYQSSESKSGSGATTSSDGGSFDEARKFPLPPELTDEIEGERLDMQDVKRISDLKDRRTERPIPPTQRPGPDRQDILNRLKDDKSGSKDIGVVLEEVGSEIITRTIDESGSSSSYTEDREKMESNSSITGSVFQNSEIFIKAHTSSNIENVEESKKA